jgi:hypothetical protein
MAATGVLDVGSVQYGRLSKSVAGSANVTLTQTEYENGVLELTGVITGNIQVILPLIDGRTWVCKNGTTGVFTVTLIGATGTGIVIATGMTAIVRTDGVNFLRVTADV